jgi:dipeptidyl aminopeptidase/acylaminoacyl peptidase
VPRDLGGVANLDDTARRVRIPVGSGDALDGWWIPGGARGTIVIFHGYGRDHTRAWRYAQFLHRAGYGIVTADFRSSRLRDRKPTTLGAYEVEDARAVLAWVKARPEPRGRPIGLMGESLGGSVALVTASEHPEVSAIVVDCPFANGRRALEDSSVRWAHLPAWPAAPLARALGLMFTRHDPYALDAIAAAHALAPRPLLVIASENDDRFSVPQSADLWRAAGSEADGYWLLKGTVSHNEGWTKDRAEYERRVLAFFDRHLLAGTGALAGVATREVPALPAKSKAL